MVGFIKTKNNIMEKIIYVLVDCDGDAICSFEDKEQAIKEAKESGCDVEELRYIAKQ